MTRLITWLILGLIRAYQLLFHPLHPCRLPLPADLLRLCPRSNRATWRLHGRLACPKTPCPLPPVRWFRA